MTFQFKNYVEASGGFIRRIEWIGRTGAPDTVVIRRGKTMWVEFKVPGMRPYARQQREHRLMRRHRAIVVVVDRFFANADEFEQFMYEFGMS